MDVDLTEGTLVTMVNHTPQHLATQVADGAGLVGGQLEGVAVLGDGRGLHIYQDLIASQWNDKLKYTYYTTYVHVHCIYVHCNYSM